MLFATPLLSQDAPMTEATADELIKLLAPKSNGVRLRGIVVAPRSVDLAVEFEYASSRLTAQAKEQLDELAKALHSDLLSGTRFRLGGHTDAVGGHTYNQALSEQRAQAVASYLVSNHSVQAWRLDIQGFGEQRLLYPEQPSDPRNRRVEVTVLE